MLEDSKVKQNKKRPIGFAKSKLKANFCAIPVN